MTFEESACAGVPDFPVGTVSLMLSARNPYLCIGDRSPLSDHSCLNLHRGKKLRTISPKHLAGLKASLEEFGASDLFRVLNYEVLKVGYTGREYNRPSVPSGQQVETSWRRQVCSGRSLWGFLYARV